MLEAGALPAVLLSHLARSPTKTSPSHTLWGIFASSEVQKITHKVSSHSGFPSASLCLSLLSLPFSFSFKVNLSDCYNVIVFLAPSVVSPCSLCPSVFQESMREGLLRKERSSGTAAKAL